MTAFKNENNDSKAQNGDFEKNEFFDETRKILKSLSVMPPPENSFN